MAKKKYELAVKIGSYQDRQTGEQRNRYHNIGVVMQGDDGGHYMLLDPMVNLAAVPRENGKDRVMVSMFTPKDETQGAPAAAAPRQAPAHRPAPAQQPMDDEIPF